MTARHLELIARRECHREIGITGDRSCPELARVVHCRSCPVFADIADTLFRRSAPAGYLEDVTRTIADGTAAVMEERASILVFRLGEEWLGLPTETCSFLSSASPTRALPMRSNDVFRGLSVHRGEVLLTVSLRALLGHPRADGRLAVAIGTGDRRWLFDVDEVSGVHRHAPTDVRNAPSSDLEEAPSYLLSVVKTGERDVGVLDVEALDRAFRRSLRQ